MAISKLILNGEVQMDVTSDTVEANKLLSGETATKNDGTKVTGTFVAPDPVISSLSVTPTESAQTFNEASISGYKPVTVGAIASDYVGSAIPRMSSANMTQRNAYVYASAGYYSTSARYELSVYTHLDPSINFYADSGYIDVTHDAYNVIINDGLTTGDAYTYSSYQLPTLSAQTITPTESSQYISSYRWLTGSQTIEAIASDYIGSAVPLRDSADMEQHYDQVSTPSGYYSETAIYNLPTYSHLAPEIWLQKSTGYVYAEHNASDAIMADPPGILTGQAYTQSMYQLLTLSAQTITPTESVQYISSYQWLTGSQTIAAIPSSYVGSAVPMRSEADMTVAASYVLAQSGYYSSNVGVYVSSGDTSLSTSIVSSTGYVNTKLVVSAGYIPNRTINWPYILPTLSAQTYIPGSISQYISSYQWLTGSQTIAAIPSSYIIPSGTYSVTENGTYDIGSYASVDVSVSGGDDYGDIIIQRQLSTISTIYSNDRVTTIGLAALAGMSGVTSFDFPNVTSVGSGAFSSCKSLTTINLPNLTYLGTGAFSFCTSLKDINMPAQSIIRNSTFMACYSLSTFDFQSVTSIDAYAFFNCSGLTSVDAPLISGSKLGSNAFYGCNHLTTVSMPNITSIPQFAFYWATRLESIYMPNVIRISSCAFASCTTLASIDLPNVWYISASAFYKCLSLTSVGLPKTVSIFEEAFASTALSGTLYLPSLETIGSKAFANTNIESVDFPIINGLGSFCFYSCSLLTSISIPKCTIIHEKAFLGAGLPGIKLPICSSIGSGAFQHASSLSWVFISGTSPLTIQSYAFAECTSLISIYLLNNTNYAYLLSSNAFDSTPFRYTSYMGFTGSIFVRESMYSRYVTAPDWRTVSGRFVSLTDNEIDPIIHCGSVVHAGQMVSSSAQYTMYAATDTFSYYLTEGSTYVLFDVLKYKDTNASYHLIANTPGVSFVASVNESIPHKSTGDVTYAVGAAFDHAAFLWQFPDSITDVSEVICDYTICEYNA